MNNKFSVYQNHSLKLRPQQIHRLKELIIPKRNLDNPQSIVFNTQQSDQNEARLDIKLFSKELAKLLESNQETIEEELRQVALNRNLNFEDFKQFQQEFISQLYTNPSHPLDMQVSQLNEIRKDFEEAALRAKDKNSSNEGIPIDGFSQILARKMNMDPSRIQKFLQRSAFFNQITWNEFQSMLDKESTIRDELLDWFMHKESPNSLTDQNEYSLEEKIEYDLKPKERTSQRVFVIEYFIEMKVDKRNYFLVIFDESTIAVYSGDNFQSALEFVIPYDPSQPAVQEKNKKNKQNTSNGEDNLLYDNQNERTYDKANQNLQRQKETPKKRQIVSASKKYRISDSTFSQDYSYYNIPVGQSVSTKKQNLMEESYMYDDYKGHIINTTESSNPNNNNNYNNRDTPQKRSMTSNSRQKRLTQKLQAKPMKASVIHEDSYSDVNQSMMRGKQTFGIKNNYNNDMSVNESLYFSNFKKQGLTHSNNKYLEKQIGYKQNGPQQIQKQDRSRSMNQSIFSMNASISGFRQEGLKKNTLNQSSILNDSRQEQSYLQSTNYNSLIRGEFKRTVSGTMDQTQNRKFHQSASMRMNESIISIGSQQAKKGNLRRDSNGTSQIPIRKISGDKLKRDEKREGTYKNNNLFVDENLYKMEEDPEFYKIIKIYLTSEIRDEDDKKKILSIESFYEIYKREPYKYPYNGVSLTPKADIEVCASKIN